MARNFADMSTCASISLDQKVSVTTHNGESESWKSPERRFMGLYNPGATCYMNSLLQTLFMTPEFRLKLYSFLYDKETHGKPENCIPFQLQMLFARLQQGHFNPVETTDLIQSFQWDTSDTFIQHDAQEFCRILFDAIEISVKDHPPLATMIQDLYGGTLLDYLKCLHCGNESSREDSFLDLSLTVRCDSDNLYNSSVEKAISSYLTPELLHGENQVFCEKCGQKEDAMKGFKLKSLPYILMLQLKRFDLDVTLMQRRKLNDSVSFPQVLNMNPFFNNTSTTSKSESQSSDSESSLSPTHSPNSLEDLPLIYHLTSINEIILSDMETNPLRMDNIALRRLRDRRAVERKERARRQIDEFKMEGDHVYELFSVMVHSGSSLGGHYYAYIKCFENYRWYDFDDSRVGEIDDEDLEKAFGGESSLYGTSAYLLMYRKVAPCNLVTVDSSLIPSEVFAQVEKEALVPDYDQLVIFNLYVMDNHRHQVSVLKTSTFEELKRRAIDIIHIPKDPEHIRLWLYEPHYSVIIEPLDPDRRIEDFLLTTDHKFIRVEIKHENESFEPFDPKDIHLTIIYQRDSDLEPKCDFLILAIRRDAKIWQLVQRIKERTGVARLGVFRGRKRIEFISTPESAEKTLIQMRLFDGGSIYAENETTTQTFWLKLMEPFRNCCIRFNGLSSDPSSETEQEPDHYIFTEKGISSAGVRNTIAKNLGVEANGLVLRRFGKGGIEVKEDREPMEGVRHGMILYVENGEPAHVTQLRINLDFAEPSMEPDSQWYSFTPMGQFLMLRTDTVAILKEKMLSHAAIAQRNLSSEDLCVRERLPDRLGQVFDSSSPLCSCLRSERKRLAIQLLSSHFPYQFFMKTIPIAFRVWNPVTYEMTTARDVWVCEEVSGEELGRTLARLVHLPLARLEVCRITFLGTFSRLSLWKARWHSLDGLQASITAFPLFLTARGGFLVVKDASKPVSQPTDKEIRLYSWRPLPRVLEPVHSRLKEKSIKITVKVEKSN